MGALEKVVLAYPAPFWPRRPEWIGIAADDGRSLEYLNLWVLLRIPAVVGFTGGRAARRQATEPADRTAREAADRLARTSGIT